MSKNLYRIVLMFIVTSFDFFSAIEVAFFFQKSLSASEIYLIYAIFSILVFVLEVPTGYIGDKIGHKNSILIGLFCGIIGFCGLIFFKGFYGIIISYFSMALMTSLISGSDEAILYDCLKQDGRENDFESVYAKTESFSYAASIVANILAGIIATFSMTIDVLVQISFLIIAFLIFVGTNVISGFVDEENNIVGVKEKVKESKMLIMLLVLAGLFMTSTLLGTKFSQQIMLAGNIPLSLFGVFTAIMTLVASLFSYIAPKITWIPFSILMLIPSVILIIIGISGKSAFILLLILTSMSRAMGNIKLSAYINNQISSKYRATINSIKSLLFRVFYSIIIFVGGKMADVNVFSAVMLCGIVLTVLIVGLLIIRRCIVKNDLSAAK